MTQETTTNDKHPLLRYFVCTAGIILAFLGIVYGSFLPFTRSQRFIQALNALGGGQIKSFQDFQTTFDGVFNYYAPVGNEEVAKFLAGDVMQLVSQPGQPEAIARMVVQYIEPHMFKNDVRHLLSLGQMYYTLWKNYGKSSDYVTAEGYYLKALAIGPKLPPVLYSLLSIYAEAGQIAKVKAVAETILTYWPQDTSVQQALAAANVALASSTATSTSAQKHK